jgi:hypothetical protein
MKFAKTTAVAAGAIALVAVGGAGAHAAGGLIHSDQIAPNAIHATNIKPGAVTLNKLSPWAQSHLEAKKGAKGATGAPGKDGKDGAPGVDGANGKDGFNPATAVDANGDSGFNLSGSGDGGAASITGGELLLTGSGVDGTTVQGGIGIAKAYNNVPLSDLDDLSYDWHLNVPNATQAPSIHITVTGLTNNSHFGSGFANLTYSPGINNGGVPATPGVDVTSDASVGNWYSTTMAGGTGKGSISDPQPLSYFVGNNSNAVITQISLDNGGSSNGSGAFSAGADNLVIGFSGDQFARYDFGS